MDGPTAWVLCTLIVSLTVMGIAVLVFIDEERNRRDMR